MDTFSGARYSATAMRRFYPAIQGRNLTFQPSQYGRYYGEDAAASAAPATTPAPEEKKSFWSFLSTTTSSEGFKEATGAITGTLLGKALSGLDQKQLDREAKRQAMLMESTARAEEARGRTVALQAALAGGSGPSALVWVGGGLALLTLAGVGIYFATRSSSKEVA
jgi:hypothetical protein